MDQIQIAVFLSTLLCSLVAGFVFAFTIVIMPGIKSLSDHDFLQAFNVMDRVIQNNQPIFVLVWLGCGAVDLSTNQTLTEKLSSTRKPNKPVQATATSAVPDL